MYTVLIVLSALLSLGCSLPYIRDVLRRNTKPRVVSWFNWTLLTGIATAAALADKQYASAVLTGAATLETAVVTVLAIRIGDGKFELLDIACQVGAVAGLVLWMIFNDPVVAIVASILIDFIVGLPTQKHAWQKPHEETRIAFVLAGMGGLCATAAAFYDNFSGLLFPAYITIVNFVIVGLITYSPHNRSFKNKVTS